MPFSSVGPASLLWKMLLHISGKSVASSLKVRFLIYIIRYIKSEGRASLTQPSLILRLFGGILSSFLRRSQSVSSALRLSENLLLRVQERIGLARAERCGMP